MNDDRDDAPSSGFVWTVHQFATICGQPWYSLQKQNDNGVQWAATGYRHEVDELARQLGVTPQELPPIAESEYYRRVAGETPEEPTPKTTGRGIWQPKQ